MACRGLYVFKHDSPLGNAPSHTLFERITARKRDGVEAPREFIDYTVLVDGAEMKAGEERMPVEGVVLTRRW
jgi:CRISPR-associated protein Csd2